MKNHIKIYPLLTAIFLACTLTIAKDIKKNSQASNLVIIVMNGVRYNDAFGDNNHLYIENIWNKLRPLGTICTRFYNKELTYPIPSQASLLTGVWHIFEDPLSENIRPAFPTLFEYWNSNRKTSGNSCYFASSKTKLEMLTYSDHKDYGKNYAPVFETNKEDSVNENAIYEKVIPYILEKHPSFIYICLGSGGGNEHHRLAHECLAKEKKDACGGEGLLNAYYESIILSDAIVYDLWYRIQQEEFYKGKTIFMVLSDHGRHTNDFNGFGDKCQGCRQLYLLAIGPGIKKDFISKQKRTLIDICRTVGAIFDIPSPYAKGKILKEIFE